MKLLCSSVLPVRFSTTANTETLQHAQLLCSLRGQQSKSRSKVAENSAKIATVLHFSVLKKFQVLDAPPGLARTGFMEGKHKFASYMPRKVVNLFKKRRFRTAKVKKKNSSFQKCKPELGNTFKALNALRLTVQKSK